MEDDIYLMGRVWRDELIIDLLGFGGQFRCFAFLEILARQVEGNVLLTELWDQEGSEEAESIWVTKRTEDSQILHLEAKCEEPSSAT